MAGALLLRFGGLVGSALAAAHQFSPSGGRQGSSLPRAKDFPW